MYADRRSAGHGLDPRSATIALAINGAVLAALIFASPQVVNIHRDHPLETINIEIPPPPEPLPPPKPVTRANPAPHPIVAPVPIVPVTPTIDPGPITFPTIPAAASDGTRTGTSTATATPAPTPSPALVGPEVDPRFARALQPDYPAEETRAMREGRVVVRVLIGVDGHVKQVEKSSATSDAFWRATQRQALAHWRFRPATRGGVPEEAWRTMAISFVLHE